jgi:gliding motility-associated lipoprotein GldD
MTKLLISLFLLATLLPLAGCKKVYVPKPRGYFKIEFPDKSYTASTLKLPYTFEYPVYAKLQPDTSRLAEPFWINIEIPENKAKVHLSYKSIKGNLQKLSEESRELVYKHTIKAFAINETFYENDDKKVYGILYEIKGNAASPMQFQLTDSLHHFVRGSFYISEVPNYDSLKPVIDFLVKDIDHLIETFTWN